MENNTIISNELEQMRSQIGILKEKLEKQSIVNELHIRRSMKSKLSDINRTVNWTIAAGTFAIIYCTWYFWYQKLSAAFTIATFIMLAVCLALTVIQKRTLGSLDFAKGNLVETAQKLNKVRSHYKDWYKIAIPMIVLWLGWLTYEMIDTLGISPLTAGFFVGAGTGVIIGGFIGYRINRKVVRKASEILDQIKDLENEA